jgi:hypothetical protein
MGTPKRKDFFLPLDHRPQSKIFHTNRTYLMRGPHFVLVFEFQAKVSKIHIFHKVRKVSHLFFHYSLTTNVAKAVWWIDTISTSHQGCSCHFYHKHKNRERGWVMEASRWQRRKIPSFLTTLRGKTRPSTALKLTHIVVLPKPVSRDKKTILFYGFTPFKWF